MTTLLFTTTLALIFRSSDAYSTSGFFLYVLSGFTLWTFIQNSIVASTDVIQRRLEFATHNNLTLAGLFAKLLVDRLFEYGINLIVLISMIALFSLGSFGVVFLLFVPFMAIIVATSLATAYLINIVTIFFPDLANLIKTGARFMFFASPIFWVASDSTGVRQFLSTFNPVSYYLGICRQVFGIEPFDATTWMTCFLISVLVCVAGYITYARTHSFVRNIK